MAKQVSKFRRIFNIWFWSLFGLGTIIVTLVFYLIIHGSIGYLPEVDQLQSPINKYATEIYSSDMQLLGSYSRSNNNRIRTEYKEISKYVIQALISTEDSRYYEHSGIDGIALTRTIIKTIVLGDRSSGGGSTITQQLAKQLYSPETSNLIQRALQKPIEWVIAVQLERLYTKEEIITLYLNQFSFINNAVGITSAAQVYFNKPANKLKIEEAATLVGMCKNPAYFNPVRHNDRTRGRRNVVLDQMRKAGYLSRTSCDSLQQMPLELTYQKVDHKMGIAPYFRENLRLMLTAKEPVRSKYASWQDQEYLDDKWQWENNPLYGFCNKYSKPDGSNYDLYADGLKVYTTIDSRMQKYAEESVQEHLSGLQKDFFKEKKGRSYAPFSKDVEQKDIDRILDRSVKDSERYYWLKHKGLSDIEIAKNFNEPVEMQVYSYNGLIDTVLTPMDSIKYLKYFLRCGFVSMDPKTGHVKAYIGGPDFSHFQYDMASKGRRQVGSTIKPYLYTLAMEEGMWPCDKVVNKPYTLITATGESWTPRNDSKSRVGENVSLRWGLANSNNWISAYLMSLFTPESLVKMIRSFGVRSQLDPVVSLCLGPADISVQEMVGAYTAFPNKGIRVEPLYVTRIEDANGNVIASFTPKMHEIFSESTSYKMIYMMRGVVDMGTGARLRYRYNLQAQIAGKTGTTQNNSDGWFMGYTPSLVSGTWVGGEDRSIHFDGLARGQGASMALPIWALYMQKIYKDPTLGYDQNEQFDVPSSFNANEGCEILFE